MLNLWRGNPVKRLNSFQRKGRLTLPVSFFADDSACESHNRQLFVNEELTAQTLITKVVARSFAGKEAPSFVDSFSKDDVRANNLF
jgi:hypothetical protein